MVVAIMDEIVGTINAMLQCFKAIFDWSMCKILFSNWSTAAKHLQ